MTFIQAINILSGGGFISHESWEDGSFIWMKPEALVKSEWCKDPVLKMLADANGGEVKCAPVLSKYSMKTRSVFPWAPSNAELSSEGWVKVNVELDSDGLAVRKFDRGSKEKKKEYKEGDLFTGADFIKKPTK